VRKKSGERTFLLGNLATCLSVIMYDTLAKTKPEMNAVNPHQGKQKTVSG
jgi:hypothetical protein